MAIIHEGELESLKESYPGEVIIVERGRGRYDGHDYREIRVDFRDCNKVEQFRVFQIQNGRGVQLRLRI